MAKTMEEVLERFRTIEFHDDFDMIVAIANGGIVPAGIINQRLQKEVHLLRINLRDEYQHPKYDAPQLLAPVDFNFRGKSILLVDDRIKTGATIKLARKRLSRGSADVQTGHVQPISGTPVDVPLPNIVSFIKQ